MKMRNQLLISESMKEYLLVFTQLEVSSLLGFQYDLVRIWVFTIGWVVIFKPIF